MKSLSQRNPILEPLTLKATLQAPCTLEGLPQALNPKSPQSKDGGRSGQRLIASPEAVGVAVFFLSGLLV